MTMARVDGHLHVWDLSVSDYAWLDRGPAELRRSHLPDEAATVLAAAGIASAVLVQAEDSTVDTAYLLDVAEQHAFVAGVVGWVRLDDAATAERQLDDLGGGLVGIRHLVHDDPRDDFLDLPEVRRSLAVLAERGLTFDVPDAWPRHLDATARLAADLPDLTIVVDHLAKPPRGGAELAAWETALRRTAAHSNTVAKVSGLHQPGQPLTAEALRPVFDIALEAFGPGRLMYGGDWPVSVLSGGYDAHLRVAEALIGTLSPEEQGRVFRGTATRTYALEGSAA